MDTIMRTVVSVGLTASSVGLECIFLSAFYSEKDLSVCGYIIIYQYFSQIYTINVGQ